MSTAIPSLHNGPTDVLVDMQKKLWSLIAFAFSNPGSISNVLEDELISFRKLDARYGIERDELASHFQTELSNAVDRLFPSEGLIVTVSADATDEVKYNLIVTIAAGTQVVLNSPIPIEDGKAQVTNWDSVI